MKNLFFLLAKPLIRHLVSLLQTDRLDGGERCLQFLCKYLERYQAIIIVNALYAILYEAVDLIDGEDSDSNESGDVYHDN